ncbi:MAG: hypothetical protein Q4F72_07660, partial [Desulfovibrionaceae bacterium]|nr:hypothetical protein [Desulfovibrionaceae bacterium]
MRPETDIAALVREGMELKTRMQADRARLREIADRLAGLAVFRPNSATGWVITAGCRARVQVRRTVTWDQERLAAAREAAGPEAFDRVFAAEYRPVSIRACRAWLEDDSVGAEAKALVRAACLVGEGRAYLSSAEFPGDGAERCAGTEAEADAAAPGALPEVP